MRHHPIRPGLICFLALIAASVPAAAEEYLRQHTDTFGDQRAGIDFEHRLSAGRGQWRWIKSFYSHASERVTGHFLGYNFEVAHAQVACDAHSALFVPIGAATGSFTLFNDLYTVSSLELGPLTVTPQSSSNYRHVNVWGVRHTIPLGPLQINLGINAYLEASTSFNDARLLSSDGAWAGITGRGRMGIGVGVSAYASIGVNVIVGGASVEVRVSVTLASGGLTNWFSVTLSSLSSDLNLDIQQSVTVRVTASWWVGLDLGFVTIKLYSDSATWEPVHRDWTLYSRNVYQIRA